MLTWLFKKPGKLDKPSVQTPPAAAVARPQAARAAPAAPKPRPSETEVAEWAARLQAAQGDDAALLQLAQTAPLIETRLAAVSALAGEAVLRQAERAFRSHDRKVHRVAKQRLEAAVAQREARAKAQLLLERARALLGEVQVPVNHLVELDHEWAALPSAVLEPAQVADFTELRAGLGATLREHTDAQQRQQRWLAEAKKSLPEWRSGLLAVAEQGGTADLSAWAQAIGQCRSERPEAQATAQLDDTLAELLQSGARVQARLAWLETPPGTDDVENVATADDAAAPGPVPTWDALPPLPDGELARALQRRHELFVQAAEPVAPAPAAPAVKPVRPPKAPALSAEQRQQLEALLQQGESALAEGQLGEMQSRLQAVDALIAKTRAPGLPEHLRARHQILWAERARLKDWQQWGGSRAREDLAAEAEALARSTLPLAGAPALVAAASAADASLPATVDDAASTIAAAEPAAPAPLPERAPAPERPKLNLQKLGDRIQALRKRWKELDHLGAAASLELWQRFDTALHTAYQPIAAQHAVLQAARLENLATREALLAALEGVAAPRAEAPDARELSRALDRFHLAWRKLGPLEHTVPAEARAPLQDRLRAAVERIEQPLQGARQAATDRREQLIRRTEALAQEQGAPKPAGVVTAQVRELQAQWQEDARQLPLPRALESALWTRFRAATDAVFAQREAAFAARDSELAANLAAAQALVERLAALSADTPEAEIRRTLAEVDRAWHQGGEVPRGALPALQARHDTVRAAASELIAAGARLRWQVQCDTLAARLAMCAEREAGQADGTGLAERWAAPAGLPVPWEQALAQRWARPVAPGPLAEAAFDDCLLQIEAALDLPATPERQDARRQLKLRALKDAMDSRGSVKKGPGTPAECWLAALRQGAPAPAQHERVLALVAALRQAPPGALGQPPVS